MAANGLRLSGDGGVADGVRCSRGLGGASRLLILKNDRIRVI